MCHCDIPYQICFYIAAPCRMLSWIIWLMLTGAFITGRIQMVAAKFYFYTLPIKQRPDSTIFKPVSISIIRDMQLWKKYDQLAALVSGLSDKMKDSIRWGLRFDFLFMFFSYGAMYLLVRWVTHCHVQTNAWATIWMFTRCLPLIAWGMDILENIWTVRILNDISKTKANLQRIFSALKWVSVFIYGGVWIVYGISLLAQSHLFNH